MPTSGGADRSEEINKRFDETFGSFDEAVRTAQAQIAKEREEAGGGAGAGTITEGESDGRDGDGEGGEGPDRPGGLKSVKNSTKPGPEQPDDNPNISNEQGGVGGGISSGRGPASIPSDIPDGRDDDIVARQIREAAMKETDPELREALWEEYRRYKRGR
jgi:hypothetical protein